MLASRVQSEAFRAVATCRVWMVVVVWVYVGLLVRWVERLQEQKHFVISEVREEWSRFAQWATEEMRSAD